MNPVQAGFVTEAEYWKWSSAHDYAGGKGGLIDVIFMNWRDASETLGNCGSKRDA